MIAVGIIRSEGTKKKGIAFLKSFVFLTQHNTDPMMKPRILWMILLTGLTLTVFGQAPLQVMSYNVRHCAGMDWVLDYDRTARVIQRQLPDVLALQELDSMTGRSERCYQLGELARRTLYHPVYGAAIGFDGGKYGVGILTREAPLSWKTLPLPGEEPRVLLVVELQDYVIACTHLDLEDTCRLASVPLIVEEARHWDKPFLLAGDWNDTPTRSCYKKWRNISRSFRATKPPTLPTHRRNASTTSPSSRTIPPPFCPPKSSTNPKPPTTGRWWLAWGCNYPHLASQSGCSQNTSPPACFAISSICERSSSNNCCSRFLERRPLFS